MHQALARFFQFERHGTTLGREATAGLTTFVTMAYIVVVNPKILEAAGMPFGPAMVATILTAAFGTLLMGLYANRPFAIAPYLGENAFIAGALFTLLTLFGVRRWLADAIPVSLKIGFAVGIGLFLAFVGLNETGIVRIGVPGDTWATCGTRACCWPWQASC
jgi:AGZA family xanthine/uracil permease-like MFS transporter